MAKIKFEIHPKDGSPGKNVYDHDKKCKIKKQKKSKAKEPSGKEKNCSYRKDFFSKTNIFFIFDFGAAKTNKVENPINRYHFISYEYSNSRLS